MLLHYFFKNKKPLLSSGLSVSYDICSLKNPRENEDFLAGVVRIELTTRGFGDRCSTS